MNHLANSGVIRHELLTLILKCDQTSWLYPKNSVMVSEAQGSTVVCLVKSASVKQCCGETRYDLWLCLRRSEVRASTLPAQRDADGPSHPGLGNSSLARLLTPGDPSQEISVDPLPELTSAIAALVTG